MPVTLPFERLKTYSIKRRKSKVHVAEFAKAPHRSLSFKQFFASLPDVLAARSFREIVRAIRQARARHKPVILFMGAHVVKCGLSPLIVSMIEKGWVTHLGTNGAAMIHDYELAAFGQTSEDVAQELGNGRFGMARETADFINRATKEAFARGLGLGRTLGEAIDRARFKHRRWSVFRSCYKAAVPATVHVAIGTDIVHQHPSFSGQAAGEASYRDFRTLAETVSKLGGGGVVLNVGSTVLMPEVFLKALSVARNLKGQVRNFVTANFDMFPHYRPFVNIVQRPVLPGGKGYMVIGHHEILIPMLAAALETGA